MRQSTYVVIQHQSHSCKLCRSLAALTIEGNATVYKNTPFDLSKRMSFDHTSEVTLPVHLVMSSKQTSSLASSATALIAELSKLNPETFANVHEERYKAIELSKKLTATLEGPVNRATELVFKVRFLIAPLRTTNTLTLCDL